MEPLTPQILRDNIVCAIESRHVQPGYERSLAPSAGAIAEFAYAPDPGAEAQAPPGFFLEWHKTREIQFMLALLEGAGDSLVNVELDFPLFTVDPTFPSTTNRTRYDVEYVLTLTNELGSPPEARTELFAGKAKWELSGGDRLFWTLLYWEDIAPLDLPGRTVVGTLGTLRALVGPF